MNLEMITRYFPTQC